MPTCCAWGGGTEQTWWASVTLSVPGRGTLPGLALQALLPAAAEVLEGTAVLIEGTPPTPFPPFLQGLLLLGREGPVGLANPNSHCILLFYETKHRKYKRYCNKHPTPPSK